MLVTMLKKYRNFKCIAGKCTDSCCDGWRIDIDDATANNYKENGGALSKRFSESLVSDENGYYFTLEGSRCPFLNKENTCDIYLKLGEKALSKTCTAFPRKIDVYGNEMLVYLNMSCPHAARLMLFDEGMAIEQYEENKENEEKCNKKAGLCEILNKKTQELFIDIFDNLAYEHLSMKRKLIIMLYLSNVIKNNYVEQALEFVSDLTIKELLDLNDKLPTKAALTNEELKRTLTEDIISYYKELCSTRIHKSKTNDILKEYTYKSEAITHLDEKIIKNFLKYYIIRHIRSSKNQNEIYDNVVMMVTSYIVITQLLSNCTERNNVKPSEEDYIEVIHYYCKLLEHSQKDYNCLKKYILQSVFNKITLVMVAI